jgi:hypothetical protein
MNIFEYVRIETSTKEDGNMSYNYGRKTQVKYNRKRFWEKKGFEYDSTYLMRTDFNNLSNVSVVNSKPKKFSVVHNTDALVTNNKGVLLALLTADCLPIVAFDPHSEVLALIHAGFRWQDAGIIDKAFTVMQNEFNTEPKNFLVYLGDCISPEHYKWDSNILDRTHRNSWIRKTLIKTDDPKRPYSIDLRKAAILNLEDIGVLEKNIEDSKIDCFSNSNYFSHVRSVYSNEKEGRHITLARMLL